MTRPAICLSAGTALGAAVCAAALALPGGQLAGDVAVGVAELFTAVLLWTAAPRSEHGPRGWRLLSVALVVPVVWTLLAPDGGGRGGMTSAYFSWTPTIPAYVLALLASLTFLERAQLRAAGRRVAVELALFTCACLTGVQLLMLGLDTRWESLDPGRRLTLGLAVATMSACMAMAMTLVGVIEARRQPMALALLGGSALMVAGQGLGSSPALASWADAVVAGRGLIVLGLAALCAAVLADPGPSPDPAERLRPATGAAAEFRSVAPHVAMVLAVLLVVSALLLGHRPTGATLAGVVVCVALAAVHRWLSARAERRLGLRLQRSEAYFRSLVHSGSDAVLILDDALAVTWASPALERILGPRAAALTGHRLLDAVHPEDLPTLTEALPRAGTPDAAAPGLLLLRLQDSGGAWRFLEAGVSDLRADADVGAVVLHCRDMTERNAREEALTGVAYTDPMTGLPNRAGWLQALDRALADGVPEPTALLLVELDGLDEAREHVSRDVVTTVVAEIGRRLRRTVRGEDLLARLGGGAFAVLAAGSPAEAERLAARCLAVVEQPIVTPAGILEITASIGVVPLEPGVPVDAHRGRAELAARAARAAGPGSAARYTPAMGEAAARRDRLREDLPGAAARGELSLAVQPVVALDGQRVRGIETLLRWQHPVLGQVPPAEFVAIADRAGLIGDLQRWVLAEATALGATLATALSPAGSPLRVGVNLSAAYIAGGTVVADVEAALRGSGLAPEWLVLELPEAAAMTDQPSVALDVATLRMMGVHVALDDFGTGPSGLRSLTRLPWDVLKLDVSLIARIDRDPQVRALCESIVGIGRALGLEVVAEGVETPAQLAALCGVGCGFAQGFLLARPMSPSAFTALLRDGAGLLWPGLVGSR